MEFIVGFLVVLGIIGLIVSGLIYLFTRLRAGEPIRVPLRLVLRVYIYAVIVAGLVLFSIGGLGNLLQAGFGAAFDKEFSYRPVFIKAPPPPVRVFERERTAEGEVVTVFGDGGVTLELTPEEFEEREEKQRQEQEEARLKGLDRAMDEGLINGVSLTLIGALIWGVHMVGRRRLENLEERESPLNRVYLIVVVVIFAVIAIVALAQGVPETTRYLLLEQLDEFGHRSNTPGEPMAVAIVALPIWIIYLMGTVRAMRRG